MPKRYHKTMKGGFWESWWNSTKKATSDAYNSVTGTKPSTASTTSPPSTTTTSTPSTSTPTTTNVPASTETTPKETVGGRKRRTRVKRGGFNANSPTTGIAFYASPVSGIKNAQPHNWVGGRTKRKCKHKHSKSCKHRKH